MFLVWLLCAKQGLILRPSAFDADVLSLGHFSRHTQETGYSHPVCFSKTFCLSVHTHTHTHTHTRTHTHTHTHTHTYTHTNKWQILNTSNSAHTTIISEVTLKLYTGRWVGGLTLSVFPDLFGLLQLHLAFSNLCCGLLDLLLCVHITIHSVGIALLWLVGWLTGWLIDRLIDLLLTVTVTASCLGEKK